MVLPMETDTVIDNPDEQLTESEMPPKTVSSFRPVQSCVLPCGCLLVSPLLLIILLCVLEFILAPTAFSPIRQTARFVEDHEIPNIMQELAGEWVIELPDTAYVFQDGMKGWRETRFVLNEDGTCEIHNLTLAMTNPYCGYKRYPEWTKRKLAGIWESIPQRISGLSADGGFRRDGGSTVRLYAFIIIHGEEDYTVKSRRNCYCSDLLLRSEVTERKAEDAENDYYCSGFIQVWKVQDNGQETYRLRMAGDAHNDELFMDRTGIVLKRVSKP